jgi:hypothetical protein
MDWAADSLYGKAKIYAQRAHDGSIGCALFGFWMSLSLELLALAALATIHPVLLADPTTEDNIQSVLDSKKKAASHKSFSAYYAAKLVPKKAYVKRINGNEVGLIGHVESSLLARVRNGIMISTQVEGCILMAYKQIGRS